MSLLMNAPSDRTTGPGVAHKHGKTVGICGQGPSVYPEFTEFLVREGIDSISLNPDTAIATKRMVAALEQRIILESLREMKRQA